MSDLNDKVASQIGNFFSGNWQGWEGGLGDWTLNDLNGHLDSISDTTRQELLGMGHVLTEYHTFEKEGSRGASRLWVRNDKVLMLEVNYPQTGSGPEEIMQAWGAPEGQMDFIDGIMDYENCAKVYASKGVCLMVSMSGKSTVRALFFTPCSYDHYFGSIAPYMHTGDRIGNRY